MEKKAKKSLLAGIPAWALSLLTLVVLILLLSIIEDPKSTSLSTFQIIGYVICVLWITVACFFICKTYPKSIWYTPVICNALGIMALIVYVFTDISTLSELIFWASSCVVSLTGAIIGATIGRRRIDQTK